MEKFLKERIEQKKRELEHLQECFEIDTNNSIKKPKFEDNAINALLEMKEVKKQIEELELCLQAYLYGNQKES